MKTVFIRAIEAADDEKAAVLREAVQAGSQSRFDADVSTFSQVPRSPFAYWASDDIRACFANNPRFESERRTAKVGLQTSDDFRFVRLAYEVSPRSQKSVLWFPFSKGGSFSRFYADVVLFIHWQHDGSMAKAWAESLYGGAHHWSRRLQNVDFFYRPGLTWPRRTQGGLSFRIMPRGCIFADKGPAAFVNDDASDKLLSLAAISNSRPFSALVEMQMAFGSYEVGVIQRTPIPVLDPSQISLLSKLAHRIWSLKRLLDSRTENSHALSLPALLQVAAVDLKGRAEAWANHASTLQA